MFDTTIDNDATSTTRTVPARRRGARRRAALAGAALLAFAATGTALAPSASATTTKSRVLYPGDSVCSGQYASYQVKGYGTAGLFGTTQGARFKLLKDGAVLDATPGRVFYATFDRRSSSYNFYGAGFYQVCAYNTGDQVTGVEVQIQTDNDFYR